jgi:hypothetical protein
MPKRRKNLADLFKSDEQAVDGNIYRIAAAGGLTALEWHEKITFVAIVIIQALGPFFVLYANTKGFTNIFWPFGGGDSSVGCNGQVGFVWQENNEGGLEFLGKKILGVCFIVGFHLSSYRYLTGEAETSRALHNINVAGLETDFLMNWADVAVDKDGYMEDDSYMKKNRPNPLFKPMLQFGQFMNVWSTMFCVMTLPYIFYGAEDAKSIVLDALSIAFLYSIDDVGGDLGGVDESRWNAPFVGTCAAFIDVTRKRYKNKTKGGGEGELEGLVSPDDDVADFVYPLDVEHPIPISTMQGLEQWADGTDPSEIWDEDMTYLISPVMIVDENKYPAEIFKQMDDFDEAWILPDIGAIVIALLTVWHSVMYVALGNPVCG